MVVHYFDRSEGTGGYVVELARRFAGAHDLTIYAAGIRSPVPEGVRTVLVPALRGRAYATILTFPAALSLVRGRHDIVHAQGWVANSADVVTAHIVLGAWREAAERADVVSAAGERWLGGLVTRREAQFLRSKTRAVIAPSVQVRTDLKRLYGVKDGVHVVPHGFGPPQGNEFKPAARDRLKLPHDRFIALYVGDARKGLATSLGAIARTPGAHLAVLSGSPRDGYLARADELGLANRVHWLGHLADPASGYAAADVLVHPTIYDTFGLVVAEAMSHGLPVIVSRTAGVSELLEHGVSAWILDSPGEPETAEALQAVLQDPSLRYRLGNGGKAVAATRDWDRVARETLEVYQTALRDPVKP